MTKVEQYYTEVYEEHDRLGEACDNRHKVEREIKKRVLQKYCTIKPKLKVLDIGAGTGLYSAYLAEQGCKVTACDLVPKHVEQMQKRFQQLGLSIESCVADALRLPYEDNSFDVVLLAGPLYHLDKYNQLKALQEATRVCKVNGYVIADYLSELHGYIQHVLLNKETLLYGEVGAVIDPIFTYNSFEDIQKLYLECNLYMKCAYGTDGITRFLAKDINQLSEEYLNRWMEFLWDKCQEPGLLDYSEHCLAVGCKTNSIFD